MANTNPLYNERLKLINDVLDGNSPERVPVYCTADAWIVRHAGLTFKEACVDDPLLLKGALKWLNDNFAIDASWGTGLIHPFKMTNLMGNSYYRFTDEGFQIVGGASELMKPDEYPQWIEDHAKFTADVLVPRKFAKLREMNEDQAAELLAGAIMEFTAWSEQNAELSRYSEEELGLPLICKGVVLNPMDYILDYLRDFKGLFVDIRRQPENVLKACEVIYPMQLATPAAMGLMPGDTSGVVFIPMHSATFMNPKQFEKFFFPYMKRTVEDFNAQGYKILFFCEDQWTPFMDILQDLPAGPNAYMFEKGDPVYIKSRIYEKGTYVGGLPTEFMKTHSLEENIDRTKWCLDNLAPGGKYIFSPSKSFVHKDDCPVETYAAVCRYVRENGVY